MHLTTICRSVAAALLTRALLFGLLAFQVSISANCVWADTFGSGANTFDIEFVTIGNPGNAADTTGAPNPAGAVPYIYRIGKFEISEQMIDKASALGGLGITHDTRGPDKPATSVGWGEAARFVNWLNTSTGSTPAYKFDGSGNFQLWSLGEIGYDPHNLYRNSLARYYLPSVHEWYKAAYYDPQKKVYYDYPTGSGIAPDGIDFVGDPNFEAVFFDPEHNHDPNDVTNVGLLSPYGTAGQGGNASELEETDYDLVNDSNTPDNRGNRGGSWNGNLFLLSSSERWQDDFAFFPATGFRVASISIPEPSTFVLVAIFGFVALPRKRMH